MLKPQIQFKAAVCRPLKSIIHSEMYPHPWVIAGPFLLWICSASLPSTLTRQHLVLNLISTHLTPHKFSNASSGTGNQSSLWSFNLNWKLAVMCLPVANQKTWKINVLLSAKKGWLKGLLVLHSSTKLELVNFLI